MVVLYYGLLRDILVLSDIISTFFDRKELNIMVRYRCYKANEESDNQLVMDIISTVRGRYGDSYVCRASDGDMDVGFILESNGMEYVFVSEGELTENFVKLLARLFEKDFEFKEVAESLVASVEAIFDEDDNEIRMRCTTGEQISDSEYMKHHEAVYKEIDELESLNLSKEEMQRQAQETLKKLNECWVTLTQQTNYAEFTLHINYKEKWVGFSENDSNFQLPILRLLTNTPSPL